MLKLFFLRSLCSPIHINQPLILLIMKKLVLFFLMCALCSFCSQEGSDIPIQQNGDPDPNKAYYEKFEPEDGKVLVFAGQTLTAVGGLDDYDDGYVDHFKMPAGITGYTGLPHLPGLTMTSNWGADDNNLSLYLKDDDFNNSVLSIALSLGSNTSEVSTLVTGQRDFNISYLANWCKEANRPIFLRIGIEPDNPWNPIDASAFVMAYRYVVNSFRKSNVDNVAFMFQSTGWNNVSESRLNSYYPGDDYVDWIGLSYFNYSYVEYAQAVVDFARKKEKPVAIVEAAAMLSDPVTQQLTSVLLSNSVTEQVLWEKWFGSFFELIEKNPDVIKSFSYINHDWRGESYWEGNVYSLLDSRIQTSDYISDKWVAKLSSNRYIHASNTLFDYLENRELVTKD